MNNLIVSTEHIDEVEVFDFEAVNVEMCADCDDCRDCDIVSRPTI